jgi:hypothetical protein
MAGEHSSHLGNFSRNHVKAQEGKGESPEERKREETEKAALKKTLARGAKEGDKLRGRERRGG